MSMLRNLALTLVALAFVTSAAFAQTRSIRPALLDQTVHVPNYVVPGQCWTDEGYGRFTSCTGGSN